MGAGHWTDWLSCGWAALPGLAFPRKELNMGDKGHLCICGTQCKVCLNVFMALRKGGAGGGSSCSDTSQVPSQDHLGSCLLLFLLFPRGLWCVLHPPQEALGMLPSPCPHLLVRGKPGTACCLASHLLPCLAFPGGSVAGQAVKAEPVKLLAGLLGDW